MTADSTTEMGNHRYMSRAWAWLLPVFALMLALPAAAQWLPVQNLHIGTETTDYGGESVVIEYDLAATDLTTAEPAYVFIRYSTDGGTRWDLVPPAQLRGDGYDIVSKGGTRTVRWWGSDQLGLSGNGVELKISVRALRMVRVPGGTFVARMIPGGGFDNSKSPVSEASLPTYFLAKCETTVGMYADYLNEVGKNARGWNKAMANPERCGISREDGDRYAVAPGKENFPVNFVSWYEAQAFLDWCGLRLPTELESLKALRGGIYLDGDETKQVRNPEPERKFPWGNEQPEAGGLLRCNCYIADPKRVSQLMAVNSFSKYNSPYGAADLAGNVAEWTLDWYGTPFHNSIGIDGYRMMKGGSYLDPAAGCDAIAGASQLPVKRGSIMGFRGVHADTQPRSANK